MSEARKAYTQRVLNLRRNEHFDLLSRFIDEQTIHCLFKRFESDIQSEWRRYLDANCVRYDLPLFRQDESRVPLPAKVGDLPPPSLAEDSFIVPAPTFTPPPEPTSVTAPIPSPERPTALPPIVGLIFRLPNARQNETYEQTLIYEPSSAVIHIQNVSFPAPLALTYDRGTHLVHGTPAENGEFSVKVVYRCEGDPVNCLRTDAFKFYVNADPRSLWKNLPSDRMGPHWKPDSATAFVDGPHRKIVAARTRGRSHAHVGTCCDDDFAVHRIAEGDWYIAVVADGAGSAKLSRLGSKIVVQTAEAYLRDVLSGDAGAKVLLAAEQLASAMPAYKDQLCTVLHHALYSTVGYAAHRAMKAILDETAASNGAIEAVKDLSTTLLIGVARKVQNQWLCASYWVGDGAVAVYRTGQEVQLLGVVDSGEFSGQTRFLDQNEVSQVGLLKRTAFALVEDFTAFILMTDGVSDPKFETEARLGELAEWDALWGELSPVVLNGPVGEAPEDRLLRWLDFWSPGNHDDRTIAVIY